MVQDPAWPPVEFANEKGEPQGITSDYLSLIEEKFGLRFERRLGNPLDSLPGLGT